MRPQVHVIVAFASALTLIGIWSFQITRRLRRVMAHLTRGDSSGYPEDPGGRGGT
jgi:hypothetical protein